MVNRYAPWRYVLLLVIIVLGAIYAAPNLYGEDPALQISHRVNLLNEADVNNVRSLLETEGVDYRSIELEDNNILVRFDSEEEQLRAAEPGISRLCPGLAHGEPACAQARQRHDGTGCHSPGDANRARSFTLAAAGSPLLVEKWGRKFSPRHRRAR